MTSLVFPQKVREKRRTRKPHESDTQFANLALGRPLRCRNRSRCLRQCLDGFLIECVTFRGEPRSSSFAREELDTKLALQIRHSLADRRLSNEQMSRSLPIPLPLHNSSEIPQMP